MNTSQMKTKSSAKRGFTLIEIMVATLIMVVLVGLVTQITREVLKVWTRSSGKLSANAEARIAMDLITQDLETAVFRNNGQQWLRVEGPESTGGDYQDDTVSLKLFSPALDRPMENASGTIPGDICAIGYRLAFKESYAEGEPVYALYRKVVDSETTFNDYLGGGDPATSHQGVLKTRGSADWSIGTITANENYLVSNIVEFKILIYADDGSNDPVNADEGTLKLKSGFAYAFGGADATVGANSGVQDQLLYADVKLTVVSDAGLELLRLLGDGVTGIGYEDDGSETAEDQVVREHGDTFTRRVNFMAHAL
jgi:prepilin-type N-terminal cleavage/methylation domain-containing protein